MSNPTDKQLLESIYADVHQAATAVSKAWVAEGFTKEEGEEMRRLLERATSAMTSLNCRLRGVPPPKVGD